MFDKIKKKLKGELSSNNDNPYLGMREMAFNITPEKIGVEFDNNKQVYGSIVDMKVGKGNIATMVCFINGTASLYFSTGGGIIGAGHHENVRKAVGSYLTSIHQVLPIMEITSEFDTTPKENHHIFYLLTKGGIYTLDLGLDKVSDTKETHFLFSLAQMVLTEIRKVNEKQ